MALGGQRSDHYVDMFRDVLLHEAQQQGSVLEGTVMSERMEGNKTYFDKFGKSTHYVKTSRNQPKTFDSDTFERRHVQEQLAEIDRVLDIEDLIKYTKDPRSEFVRSMNWEMGRYKDTVIMDAIKGNAVVTTNGTTANQALTQTVAVNSHQFDSGTGDVGLTTSKLKLALTLIHENYGVAPAEHIICIAPSRQLMNLSTENQQVSSDFVNRRPLETPGLIAGLSGFMGISFVAYEGTGVDGNSDELAFLFTESAVKLGIFVPLTVKYGTQPNLMTNPDSICVYEAIGATRMYEERVVQIACDPLA